MGLLDNLRTYNRIATGKIDPALAEAYQGVRDQMGSQGLLETAPTEGQKASPTYRDQQQIASMIGSGNTALQKQAMTMMLARQGYRNRAPVDSRTTAQKEMDRYNERVGPGVKKYTMPQWKREQKPKMYAEPILTVPNSKGMVDKHGNPILAGTPMAEVYARGGHVVSPADKKSQTGISSGNIVLDEINDAIFGEGGAYYEEPDEGLAGRFKQSAKIAAGGFTNPKTQTYNSNKLAYTAMIMRGLGQTDVSDTDLMAWSGLLPKTDGVPDSRAVAKMKMEILHRMVNKGSASKKDLNAGVKEVEELKAAEKDADDGSPLDPDKRVYTGKAKGKKPGDIWEEGDVVSMMMPDGSIRTGRRKPK